MDERSLLQQKMDDNEKERLFASGFTYRDSLFFSDKDLFQSSGNVRSRIIPNSWRS